MIIDKEQLIFIHIPKNAGTSIRRYFGNFSTYHETIYDFKDVFPDKYNSYRKFTIVRNPYDRMVSWYFYLKKEAEEWVKFTTCKDLLKSSETLDKKRFDKEFTDNFIKWVIDPFKYPHTCRALPKHANHDLRLTKMQHEWIDDTVTILKYENLNEELNKYFGKEIKLSNQNKSIHMNYLNYYNKYSLDLVYEKYKEDFEKFNYKRIEKI